MENYCVLFTVEAEFFFFFFFFLNKILFRFSVLHNVPHHDPTNITWSHISKSRLQNRTNRRRTPLLTYILLLVNELDLPMYTSDEPQQGTQRTDEPVIHFKFFSLSTVGYRLLPPLSVSKWRSVFQPGGRLCLWMSWRLRRQKLLTPEGPLPHLALQRFTFSLLSSFFCLSAQTLDLQSFFFFSNFQCFHSEFVCAKPTYSPS